MATGGGSLPFKRAKFTPIEPSTSSEKISGRCPASGNVNTNGNMVSNHDSPLRKVTRTHSNKNVSTVGNKSSKYDTLHIDVALANQQFNDVSPGRRCLSDSKLTVSKAKKNIPASSHHKRKIDFNESSPSQGRMLSSKRLRSGSSVMITAPIDKVVDYNQNVKEVTECVASRTVYKSMHSIGNRRSSTHHSPPTVPKSQTNSQTSLLPYESRHETQTTTLMNNVNSTVVGLVKAVPLQCPESLAYLPFIEQKVTTPSTPDSLLEDIADKFLKVDNDILFKKESAIEMFNNCDGPKRAMPTTDFIAESNLAHLTPCAYHTPGDDNPSGSHTAVSDSCEDESSVFTEDSTTTEDSLFTKEAGTVGNNGTCRKKKKLTKATCENQLRAPRKRRIASLTAETKVHLMFERDDMDAVKKQTMAKSKKLTRKHSTARGVGLLSGCTCPSTSYIQYKDLTEYTKCNLHCIGRPLNNVMADGVATVAVTTNNVTAVDGRPVVPDVIRTNSVTTNSRTLNNISLRPAQDVPLNLVLTGQRACVTDQSNWLTDRRHCLPNQHTSQSNPSPLVDHQYHEAAASLQSPMSAPVISTSKRPTLASASMRRATVDTAECQKLEYILKNPLILKVSRHSTDDMQTASANKLPDLHVVNKTIEQLGLLQTGGMIHVSSLFNGPPIHDPLAATANYHTPKPHTPKKILHPANLKPATKAGRKKSTNGWKGVGEPVLKPVILRNDTVREFRYCYSAIRRKEDNIHTQDCVLLRAGTNRRKEPAYVAKVAYLWEEPDTGDLTMTLLWYYQPEHTDAGRLPNQLENELFACRHWDVNSVACIEDRCYVLTPAEYSRYRAKLKRKKEAVNPGRPCVPEPPNSEPRSRRLPRNDTSPANVFLCRQVYDFRQHRVLKNPS